MNSSFQRPSPADSSRRSKQVALVLLGTMGVVGGAVVWDAWQRAQPDDLATTEQPASPAPPVAADRNALSTETPLPTPLPTPTGAGAGSDVAVNAKTHSAASVGRVSPATQTGAWRW
jgi:hypothetical protein